jgi:hypothetical protein
MPLTQSGAPIYVTKDTTAIFADTRGVAPSSYALVYLSSITTPGKTVTIRDATGDLDYATEKFLVISTTSGVHFTDGASTYTLTQPYAFLTAISQSPSTWTVANATGFSNGADIYSAQSLTASSITASTLNADMVNITSNLYVGSNMEVSTLYTRNMFIGDPASKINDPGIATYLANNYLYVDASIYNTGNLAVARGFASWGKFRLTGPAYFSSVVYFYQGLVRFAGNQVFYKDYYTFNSYQYTSDLYVDNLISTAVIRSYGEVYSRNFISTASTYTDALYTLFGNFSTLQIQSPAISIGTTALITDTKGLAFTEPIVAPAISTAALEASNEIRVGSLRIDTEILGTTLSQFSMSNTAISNVGGSLTIQDISAGQITTSTFITSVLTTQSLQTSTLQVDSLIAGGAEIIADSLEIGSISTSYLSAATAHISSLSAQSTLTNTLQVTSTLDLATIPSFITLSNTDIQNAAGALTISSIATNSLMTSTLIANDVIFSESQISLNAPSTFTSTLQVSSLTVGELQSSNIRFDKATVGDAPAVTSSNYLAFRTIISSNIASRGDGSIFRPAILSNIAPGGAYSAGYTVVDCSNVNLQPSSNVQLSLLYTFTPGTDTSSVFSYTYMTSPSTSNTTTLLGTGGTQSNNLTLTMYADVTNSLAIQFSAADSTAAFRVQAFIRDSNYTFEALNTSNGIIFNNGALTWNYGLNATTIDNPYNDMRIRNIFYYGSLSFFSDPAIKEDIELADTARCAEIVEHLPLRYYKLRDDYIQTFGVRDHHRIGFLANEVAEYFPHAVTQSYLPSGEPVLTVDFQQVKMAHIGATKALLQRVEDLEERLARAESAAIL